MQKSKERIWIPVADWLLFGATLTAIVVVLLPILLFDGRRIATAGCVAALAALAGYVLALLAHYRLILGSGRSGPRDNPEPAERTLVIGTTVVAVALFCVSLFVSDEPSAQVSELSAWNSIRR